MGVEVEEEVLGIRIKPCHDGKTILEQNNVPVLLAESRSLSSHVVRRKYMPGWCMCRLIGGSLKLWHHHLMCEHVERV